MVVNEGEKLPGLCRRKTELCPTTMLFLFEAGDAKGSGSGYVLHNVNFDVD